MPLFLTRRLGFRIFIVIFFSIPQKTSSWDLTLVKALPFQLTHLRRVETVCERYCRTVAVERSGAAGSTSRLRLPGNANAVTWRSRRHKRRRRQHEDRLHWRFLSQ